jgi:hypothetical protein
LAPSTVKALSEVLRAILTGVLSLFVIEIFCEALLPTSTLPKSTEDGFTVSPALLAPVVENALAREPHPDRPTDMANVRSAAERSATACAGAEEKDVFPLHAGKYGLIALFTLEAEKMRNSYIGVTLALQIWCFRQPMQRS